MALDHTQLERLLCERLCANVRVHRRHDDVLMLESPFTFPDGDHYPIYLSETLGGGAKLSDRGHTMMHVSYEHDVDSFHEGARASLREQTVRESDIDEEKGIFSMETPPDQVAIVVAPDWTSFARDGHETIVLSMLTGPGRVTPLMWKTVPASTLKGNQRPYEDELLRAMREAMPAGVRVTVVADRGFANRPMFQYLSEELGFEYVIRLRGDIYVTSAKGERRKASDWVAVNGCSRTLRGATVTDVHASPVGTVVCVHAKAMKESWCVVASEDKIGTRTLIRYYAKRWGIETSFRDIKDMRFGMGMSAMRIKQTQRRDRMLLLSALSIALLTLVRAAGESLGYDRWLKANTVKYRTHSLFRQGLMLYEHIPNWPEYRLRPLFEKFAQMLMERRAYREIFGVI